MDIEKLEQLIDIVSKGDTSAVETLFDKPAGRRFFESLIVIVISNLPYLQEEKDELFTAFRKALDKIEKRIKRQKDGQEILSTVYN